MTDSENRGEERANCNSTCYDSPMTTRERYVAAVEKHGENSLEAQAATADWAAEDARYRSRVELRETQRRNQRNAQKRNSR